jgi:hypothetical protein
MIELREARHPVRTDSPRRQRVFGCTMSAAVTVRSISAAWLVSTWSTLAALRAAAAYASS